MPSVAPGKLETPMCPCALQICNIMIKREQQKKKKRQRVEMRKKVTKIEMTEI
jgi:hypothetical protein